MVNGQMVNVQVRRMNCRIYYIATFSLRNLRILLNITVNLYISLNFTLAFGGENLKKLSLECGICSYIFVTVHIENNTPVLVASKSF